MNARTPRFTLSFLTLSPAALYVAPPEHAGRLLAAFPGSVVLATLPDGSRQQLPA
jgi:hypothetical protein